MFSAGPMVIFEFYIINWLQGFYNEDIGPFMAQEEVNTYYQTQGILGSLLTIVIICFIGKAVDYISIMITIPCSFLFRAFVFFLVYKIQDPVV